MNHNIEERLKQHYAEAGISRKVYEFGMKIETDLKERFETIDQIAEYNQLKVVHAMQKARVNTECFQYASGYGYNDFGRDTLEKVYAYIFIRRMLWCVRRSLVEPMPLLLPLPLICGQVMR